MVWSGLAAGRADGPCGHEYAFTGLLDAAGATTCSHGPDPAPDGIDVRRRATTAELVGGVSDGSATSATSAVPCYGNGVTGSRVQAIYAHAADVPDRYRDVVNPIGQWAANVDAVFADSAAETGGVRHVRWVTDAQCDLSVLRVQLSNTGDDSWSAMVNELGSLGLNRTDRKYLVWVDATVYCGIGGFQSDDRSSSSNANNRGPSYARVDTGCWGLSNPVEAHELMHTLGGVQYSAPHSTGGGHCTDDSDRMCYQETAQTAMTSTCPSAHERLFDCGHDDYFHTSPAAGSYLGGHWNTAASEFLESVAPPTTTSTTGSTTSTNPSPSTTAFISTTSTPNTTAPPSTSTPTSTSFAGSLSRKTTTRTYEIHAGAGTIGANISFTMASTLTARLTMADGTILTEGSGSSVLQDRVDRRGRRLPPRRAELRRQREVQGDGRVQRGVRGHPGWGDPLP